MNLKKAVSCGVILFGGLILLAGIGFTAMYVMEAVVDRLGNPDQSLLFWYLPILFIGILGVFSGLSLLIFGLKHLKKMRLQEAVNCAANCFGEIKQ